MIQSVSDSPSDMGWRPEDPIRYDVEDLVTFAQARDSYSGQFLRPELATLLDSGNLSREMKLKIAQNMLEGGRYGRISSLSEPLATITRADDDGFERDFQVYGSRNWNGQNLYFSVELTSRKLQQEKVAFERMVEPMAAREPLKPLERLVEKPQQIASPDWVNQHLEKRNFAWFPHETFEQVAKKYGDIRIESLRSYVDEGQNFIFHEVKIIQPNGGHFDIMLFKLDKLNK
ncbi:MAG: hypothetical protein KKH93_06170 [Candidatus Omnitrophica bacterium]|nr:hypothetical protein [Candidatus Omnitrophota bacterium]MBU2044963.1 hypothetical protein [Candidatus Omnitrophota bacterium]MBU2265551.1 hypothetical protein [Candidatus Omnitrophota bacterium]MBU2473553.1 hypothetical protein [Candidatus Omnitrophota bacterium]